MFNMEDFVRESNKIEGIVRSPSLAELDVHEWFLALREPSTADLINFVSVVQPGARLRNKLGQDVKVGNYLPPLGGVQIEARLVGILNSDYDPYLCHIEYELLHPFTDGNGRSGRVLWLHRMGGIEEAPLGFLQTFYYQTLQKAESRYNYSRTDGVT